MTKNEIIDYLVKTWINSSETSNEYNVRVISSSDIKNRLIYKWKMEHNDL